MEETKKKWIAGLVLIMVVGVLVVMNSRIIDREYIVHEDPCNETPIGQKAVERKPCDMYWEETFLLTPWQALKDKYFN